MFRAHSILRFILTAFVCVGFCELNWAQLNSASVQTRGEQQVISEFTCDGGLVLAVNHENNVDCQSQAGQADSVPFVFGLGETFTTARPILLITGRVMDSVAKAKSALGSRMKNKDPPVV